MGPESNDTAPFCSYCFLKRIGESLQIGEAIASCFGWVGYFLNMSFEFFKTHGLLLLLLLLL